VLHAILGVYILCFAGGVTLIVFSFFASRRLGLAAFRDFAFLFSASTLILVVEALKTYERAVGSDFGYGLHVSGAALSAVGSAGMTWYLLSLAFQIARIAPDSRREVMIGITAAALGIIGGLRELGLIFWPGAASVMILWNAQYLALLGIHVFAGVILFRGFGKIEDAWLRSAIRTFLIFLGVFAPIAAVQLVVQDIPTSPELFRDFPLEELGYYLGFVIMALVYLVRYFAEPVRAPSFSLPEDFLRKYGISHREGDIIEMMAQGFSNSAIAEKLFISTLTVKNHVYHIYQKTGAGNKVQLLNMINSSK
jgi:DNA-binding CsgD family transcriptional regulator